MGNHCKAKQFTHTCSSRYREQIQEIHTPPHTERKQIDVPLLRDGVPQISTLNSTLEDECSAFAIYYGKRGNRERIGKTNTSKELPYASSQHVVKF